MNTATEMAEAITWARELLDEYEAAKYTELVTMLNSSEHLGMVAARLSRLAERYAAEMRRVSRPTESV